MSDRIIPKWKPCPICGAKAFLKSCIIDNSFFMGYTVGCPRYSLYDGIHGHDIDTPSNERLVLYGIPTKDEAIQAWNWRAGK